MANNTIISMDSLKKDGSIRVYSGMTVVFPGSSSQETLNLSDLALKFNGCFSINNLTVCFISDNEIFVTPYTRSVIRTLRNEGFHQKYFGVPFSDDNYPKFEQPKWNSLLEKARQSYADDFVEDCITFCNVLNIGSIKNETLNNCFVMPNSGVKVKRFNFEDCYYPIITTTCLDDITTKKLGKYCAKNGCVVFVYRDGKTYVAKGYHIISKLRAAGYTESGMFVPFSDGEEILDFNLKARWESITIM